MNQLSFSTTLSRDGIHLHNPSHRLGVLGSCKELGFWNPNRVVMCSQVVNNPTEWRVEVSFQTLYEFIEYRFVVIDITTMEVLEWERRQDRRKVINDRQDELTRNLIAKQFDEYKAERQIFRKEYHRSLMSSRLNFEIDPEGEEEDLEDYEDEFVAVPQTPCGDGVYEWDELRTFGFGGEWIMEDGQYIGDGRRYFRRSTVRKVVRKVLGTGLVVGAIFSVMYFAKRWF